MVSARGAGFLSVPKWLAGLIACVLVVSLFMVAERNAVMSNILGQAEGIGLFVAILLWLQEAPARRRKAIYDAFQVIDGAEGTRNSPARLMALESLAKLKVSLRGMELSQVNLMGVRLKGIDLAAAALAETDLRHADLQAANLLEADLSKAQLSEAQLIEANLSFANLTGADLSLANLEEADLTCAILVGANLAGRQSERGEALGERVA